MLTGFVFTGVEENVRRFDSNLINSAMVCTFLWCRKKKSLISGLRAEIYEKCLLSRTEAMEAKSWSLVKFQKQGINT